MDYFERSDSEADFLPREGFPKYYQANIQKHYYVIVSLAVFTSLVYAVIIVGVHPPWLPFFAVTMWAPLCTVFSSISAVAAMNTGRKQYLLQFAIFTALGKNWCIFSSFDFLRFSGACFWNHLPIKNLP
jgi:hypothetical protein